MDPRTLKALLKLLRENGVHSYSNGEVRIIFAGESPAPVTALAAPEVDGSGVDYEPDEQPVPIWEAIERANQRRKGEGS